MKQIRDAQYTYYKYSPVLIFRHACAGAVVARFHIYNITPLFYMIQTYILVTYVYFDDYAHRKYIVHCPTIIKCVVKYLPHKLNTILNLNTTHLFMGDLNINALRL